MTPLERPDILVTFTTLFGVLKWGRLIFFVIWVTFTSVYIIIMVLQYFPVDFFQISRLDRVTLPHNKHALIVPQSLQWVKLFTFLRLLKLWRLLIWGRSQFTCYVINILAFFTPLTPLVIKRNHWSKRPPLSSRQIFSNLCRSLKLNENQLEHFVSSWTILNRICII